MRLGTIWLFLAIGLVWLTLGSCSNPIFFVTRGFSNRVQHIVARIARANLRTGSSTTPSTRAYARSMGAVNDDAGHLIGSRLGGTGRETYNIVPQNPSINRGIWRTEVEQPIYDAVNRGNVVDFQVIPVYDSPSATRPVALRYAAWLARRGGKLIVKGEMPNPKPKPKLEESSRVE